LGSLLIGWFAEYMSTRYVVALEGVLCLLAVGGYCLYRLQSQQKEDVLKGLGAA